MAEHRFGQGNQAAKGHGRPKGSGRVQVCEQWMEKKGGGWQRLIDLAEGKGRAWKIHGQRVVQVGPSEELSFEALKLIAAYGKGKPTEFIDVGSGGDSLFDFLRGVKRDIDSGRSGGK